jgi:hypothetical protein
MEATTWIARHGKTSTCERRAIRVSTADLDLDALKVLQTKRCVRCPDCEGWLGWAEPVVGRFDEGRECNARCMGATHGGVCECRCKGENHGGSHGA